MNVEQNRLISFNIWPTNAPIDPERLAKAGFYATGKALETECYWCRKRISDWQYGDQIMMRHRRLFPLCPFVLDPGATDNIPLIGPPLPAVNNRTTDSNTNELVDMKKESNRLLTFKYWPNPNISPQALSKAGFYYINLSDQVKCAWCKGVIAKWEKDDIAFDEHKRFFPDCPLVQLGPLIELANDDIRELGIQQWTPPKREKYSSLDARLRTYTNWPISDIQKPETLANAGFYYQNTDDHVRCFHCNGGLRSWQKDDDPWVDHVKWFPHCQFVKLVKGPNYVAEVQRLLLNEYSNAEPAPETPMSLEEAMCTQPVLQALEMGLNVAVVRNATLRHLQSTGRPYQSNEELVTAVLDDQNDAEEEDEEEVMPEYQQSSSRNLSRIINCFVNAGSRSEAAEAQPASSIDTVPNNIPLPASSSAGANGVDRRCECPPSQSDSDSHDDEPNTSRSSVPGPSNIDDEKPTCSDAKLERSISLEEENRKLKDARLCKICMDEEVGVVFLPCGHLVTCVQCASGINQCPLCRTDMKGFVRTFLS